MFLRALGQVLAYSNCSINVSSTNPILLSFFFYLSSDDYLGGNNYIFPHICSASIQHCVNFIVNAKLNWGETIRLASSNYSQDKNWLKESEEVSKSSPHPVAIKLDEIDFRKYFSALEIE